MRLAPLALLIALVLSFPAFAEHAPTASTAGQRILEHVFSETEKALIREYYGATEGKTMHEQCPHEGKSKCKKCKHHGHKKHGDKHGKKENCPHGAMKAKGHLPPGLEKHIRRNGQLPPGLEGRALPPGLAKRLPAPAAGTQRRIVGNDIVLVDTATQVILDVIRNVMNPPTNSGRNNFND